MEKTLKRLVREQLIIDEQEVIKRLLPRIKRLIGLTKDGKILFIVSRNQVPKIYQVLLYLVGKRLAHIAELTESPDASIKEISNALGFPENYTRALLSELLSKGLIKRSDAGLYQVELLKVEEAILLVESKLGESQ